MHLDLLLSPDRLPIGLPKKWGRLMGRRVLGLDHLLQVSLHLSTHELKGWIRFTSACLFTNTGTLAEVQMKPHLSSTSLTTTPAGKHCSSVGREPNLQFFAMKFQITMEEKDLEVKNLPARYQGDLRRPDCWSRTCLLLRQDQHLVVVRKKIN